MLASYALRAEQGSNRRKYLSLSILPFAGLLSGVLTARFLVGQVAAALGALSGFSSPPLLPALFGVIVGLLLFQVRDLRSILKPMALGGAAILASFLSHVLGVVALLLSGAVNLGGSPRNPSALIFFPAGFVGAWILFFAVLLMASPAMKAKRAFLSALSWALAGGILGVIGWGLGTSLGRFLWFSFNQWHLIRSAQRYDQAVIDFVPQSCSLYIVWQTGMAFLLGVAYWREAKSQPVSIPAASPAFPAKKLSLAGKMFAALVMILVVLNVASFLAGRRRAARYAEAVRKSEEAIAQSRREAPSLEGLPEIKPSSAEEMLIVKKIGNYLPGTPTREEIPQTRAIDPASLSLPARIRYSILYKDARPDGRVSTAEVSVTQYPNDDWANYQLRNTPHENEAVLHRGNIGSTREFGNEIFQLGSGSFWRSRDAIVLIMCKDACYDGTRDLLQEYLKKYPSTFSLLPAKPPNY